MLELPDHWVWDSWVLDVGDTYHLFFLRASRALHDPHRRHLRASVGHAISTDLRAWELRADALVHADLGGWDDLAIWTGSAVVNDDGRCWLFYTGLSHADGGLIQRIGAAVSDDFERWTRVGSQPLVEADPRWYETLDSRDWQDVTWRDPFVFRDPHGDGWHMLVTARCNAGPSSARGVVGHAWSPDLLAWEVRPPLSAPTGLPWLEVLQTREVDGLPVLVFSCWPDRSVGGIASRGGGAGDLDPQAPGGGWTAPGRSLNGPWAFTAAAPLRSPSLYAGHLVQDRDGSWSALGFRDGDGDQFGGTVGDPIAVRRDGQAIQVLLAR